jgi:acid phosphatase type 7
MAENEHSPLSFVYLSWGGDPTSTLVVNWQSAAPVGNPQVKYRAAGSDRWQQSAAQETPTPGNGHLYRATLSGLTPATTYEYRVGEYRVGESEIYHVETAPTGTSDYHFVFFCDTGLIGRPDKLTTGTAQVRDVIRKVDPLFLLGGGDYAYGNKDGRYTVMAEAGDEWFRQWQSVLPYYPFYPQYGNHEIMLVETFADWGPRFFVPNSQAEGRYYSFDVGDVHYTSVFVPDYRMLPDPAQLSWLDQDLAKARAAGARWLIVFLHSAIYGCGISHPSKPQLTNLLVPYFDKHQVDLVLSGHDQSYERTFALRHEGETPVVTQSSLDRYTQGNGVVYAKISPSGKQSEISKDFSKFQQPQQEFMAVRDDTAHHYAVINVKAAGELEVATYSIAPHGTESKLFDRFTIAAK